MKPSKDHPWRNQPSSEAVKWANQQSSIPQLRTITAARSENLSKELGRNRPNERTKN